MPPTHSPTSLCQCPTGSYWDSVISRLRDDTALPDETRDELLVQAWLDVAQAERDARVFNVVAVVSCLCYMLAPLVAVFA